MVSRVSASMPVHLCDSAVPYPITVLYHSNVSMAKYARYCRPRVRRGHHDDAFREHRPRCPQAEACFRSFPLASRIAGKSCLT